MPSEILAFERKLLDELLPVLKGELGTRIKGSLARIPGDLSALVTQANVPGAAHDGSARQRIVDIYVGEPIDGEATPFLRLYLGPNRYIDSRERVTAGAIGALFPERLEVVNILRERAWVCSRAYFAQELLAPQGQPTAAADVSAPG